MLTVERHSPQVAVDGHPAASEQLRQLSHRKTEMLRKHMRRRLAPHRRRHPERALPQLVERPRGARLRLRSQQREPRQPQRVRRPRRARLSPRPLAHEAHTSRECALLFSSLSSLLAPYLFRLSSVSTPSAAGRKRERVRAEGRESGRVGELEGLRVGGLESWRVGGFKGWRVKSNELGVMV